jgi:hypothetical protein
VPKTVGSVVSLKLAGRVRDTPFQERHGYASRYANLSECWHSVRRTGSVRDTTSPRGKPDIRYGSKEQGSGEADRDEGAFLTLDAQGLLLSRTLMEANSI